MPFILAAIPFVAEAVAAVTAAWVAIGIVGQVVILAGIGIAAGYLVQALTPKPAADNNVTPAGVKFEREYGANISRQVACGLVGIAGHDTYVNTYAASNKNIQQVYTISDYYTTALVNVAINGAYVTLGPPDPGGVGFPVTSGDFANLIYIRLVDGRQTSADSWLLANANPSTRWTSNDVGLGISAIIVTMAYDQEKNNSFPDFFFVFQGAPLYDIRKDTTAGGSGAHRWGNVATYEYSANPAVIEYNYRRGLSVNGDLFCGMAMPAADLPIDKWAAAMNICDEINVSDGLPRYQCSVLLDCMTTHSNNLQAISLSCGSMQIDGLDGSWPLIGTNQTVAMTFTDDDLVSTADVKYTQLRSMGELVNSVAGNFPDPNQLWSMVGYQPQIASAFLTIDRRTRDLNIDFPQVPVARQANQLAWIYLYENRYEAKAEIVLRPRFRVLEAGDWVNWNSARYGLKTYIVVGRSLLSLDADQPRNVVLSLQQRDPSIYAGVTPTPIVAPDRNAGPVYSTEVANFALVAVSVVGASGRAQPAIRVSWDTNADVTVVSVELIYYPTAQPSALISKTVPATRSVSVLADGIVSNTNYTVQAKIITDPVRTTAFNAGATVTTLNITIGYVDFDAAIQYNLTTLQDLYSDKISNLENMLSSLIADADARNWLDKKIIRDELSSRSDNALATIETVRIVATDATTAFASLSTTVSAQLGNMAASVNVTANAVATLDGYAGAQYAVTLDVNGYAVGFNFVNGGGGISSFTITTAKFQIAAPGVTGGAAVPIFTVGNVAGSPKIGIRADMFIDGVLTAQMIQANTITAAQIAAGTITATEIAATTITAAKIATGTITSASGVIGALSVQALSIGDNAATVPAVRSDAGAVGTTSLVVVSTVTLSIDTTGLSGKTISILAAWSGSMSYTGSGGAANATLFIDGVSIQGISTSNSQDWFLALSGSATFTGTGGVVSKTIEIWYSSGSTGNPTLSNRTLWATAAKR